MVTAKPGDLERFDEVPLREKSVWNITLCVEKLVGEYLDVSSLLEEGGECEWGGGGKAK